MADDQPKKENNPNSNKGKKGKKDAPEDGSEKGLIDVEPIKGTRDFPPEDMRVRNWLFNHWK